ncbi:hypothetical protein H0H87_009859 [Tephrocybe sp. NHM501043]|nr:hypothetical protein H0H87_009859 [Tephrocybe sp. NHM501043]
MPALRLSIRDMTSVALSAHALATPPLPTVGSTLVKDGSMNTPPSNYRIYQIVGGALGGVIFLATTALCITLYIRSYRKREKNAG